MQLLAESARELCSATAKTSAECMLRQAVRRFAEHSWHSSRPVVQGLFAALAPQFSCFKRLTQGFSGQPGLASRKTLANASKLSFLALNSAALAAAVLQNS